MLEAHPQTGRAERRNRILIADDALSIRRCARQLSEQGHEVLLASNAAEALELFYDGVDLVLLDQRLPNTSGMDLLTKMRHADPSVPVVMLSGESGVDDIVEAMRAGAISYVTKPVDLDELTSTVRRVLADTRLQRRQRDDATHGSLSVIVGESRAMQRIKSLIPRIAASPASTVLLTGQSGTGKDLVARALHELSGRKGGPWVTVNCSALPSNLLESELFGHERGAFTDAKERKQGLFEQADGGTVFLDEIGEMEPQLQAKLLRFLESKTLRRVGGSSEIHADVRVIAATNVDLKHAVQTQLFRQDLYYRLAVVTLHLPPLVERDGDIALLTAFFLERFNREFGKNIQSVAPAALELLNSHSWPGNVRELRNAIERAVLLSIGARLEVLDLDFLIEDTMERPQFQLPAEGVNVRDVERSLVEQALHRTGGNQTRAARLLGLNRDQVRYRMQRYGMLPRPGGNGRDNGKARDGLH